MTEEERDSMGVKPFAAFLQEQRGGSLHGELSEALSELVFAAQSTRGKGSLVLTIAVAPNKDGVTVTVTDKVVLKVPEGERGAAIFFVEGEGNLVRKDPRQLEIGGLREVDTVTGEVREVGGAS